MLRPKTRSAVRKAEAQAADALFGTGDVVSIKPQNTGDRFQEASAAIKQELLNYRLSRGTRRNGIRWFQIAMGAIENAKITSIVASKQSWLFQEEETGEFEAKMVTDPHTGEVTLQKAPKMRIIMDRPDIFLFPSENVLMDPNCDWTNPAQTSQYVQLRYPMAPDDALTMIENNVGSANIPWYPITREQLMGYVDDTGPMDAIAISEEQSLPDAATNIAKGALTGTIAAPILGGAAHGAGAVVGAGLGNLGASLKPAAFADKTIAEKLADAKISLSDLVDDMHAHHDAAATAGVTPSYTLADAANDALGNTARNIADRPDKAGQAARDLFEQRQTDQRNRIDGNLGELFGHDGSLETIDRVKADQIARATPLYKAAYADPIDPLVTAHPDPDSPSLKDLTPSLQRAGVFGATQDAMAIDRTPFDLNTLQPWDYMKRELDYKIKRVNAGQENTGSADLPKLRRDLIAELDAQSPNYSLAGDAWSGPAKEMESLENGANATKPGYTREQVQRDIAGATAGEKELYQLG